MALAQVPSRREHEAAAGGRPGRAASPDAPAGAGVRAARRGVLSWGPFAVDVLAGRVWVHGDEVRGLQPVQVRLLGELVGQAGFMRTRAELAGTLFGGSSGNLDRAVSVLRSRLGTARHLIVTIKGHGYGIGMPDPERQLPRPTFPNGKVSKR
jgi:DNA-binding response OmpR family regulator